DRAARPESEPAWAASRPGRNSTDPDATWMPRPLSAMGLEEFSRGTIARDDAVSAAIDASLDRDDRDDTIREPVDAVNDDDGGDGGGDADRGEFRRESTAPGIGPEPASKR